MKKKGPKISNHQSIAIHFGTEFFFLSFFLSSGNEIICFGFDFFSFFLLVIGFSSTITAAATTAATTYY